jgi:hypothetical protein
MTRKPFRGPSKLVAPLFFMNIPFVLRVSCKATRYFVTLLISQEFQANNLDFYTLLPIEIGAT